MPVMNGIGDLGYVAVALLGGVLVIKQTISVGDIQAFIQYMRNFTQPIVQVAQVSNMLQATIAASERVFEFLDGEEELDEATICPLGKLQGNVAFNSAVWLCGRQDDYPGLLGERAQRSESGDSRTYRSRQDHHGETPDALL